MTYVFDVKDGELAGDLSLAVMRLATLDPQERDILLRAADLMTVLVDQDA